MLYLFLFLSLFIIVFFLGKMILETNQRIARIHIVSKALYLLVHPRFLLRTLSKSMMDLYGEIVKKAWSCYIFLQNSLS